MIRAFSVPGGASLVHLHNVSGGILAGDCLSLKVTVGSGARAQLTTTGATRLYRHRTGSDSSTQKVSIDVAPGGLLEYLPDALIPFAGSRHRQSTTVNLAPNATFFSWEILAPGRQAMGEEFACESLRIETSVHSDSRPLMLENFLIEPASRSLRSIARLGQYSHTASFCALQIGRPSSEFRELESALAEIAHEESREGTIWGASALASDGVVVRGLSATARDLPAALFRFWTTARRFLTGEEAVPLRKLK